MISVIMPVYNGIQFLQSAIDSILNQTYSDFEFIIIDDGSIEPVFDLIKSCCDTRIKALRNEENIGLTKSLNICLSKMRSDTDYIARMDGDDLSYPNRFEEQLKLFDVSKSIGLVGCWARSINHIGESIHDFAEKCCQCSDEDLKEKYRRTICMVDPTSIYSAAAARHIGYFDEACTLGQTYNYNLRILKVFDGRVVQKGLYKRRTWYGQVGKRIRRETPGVSWSAIARKRANEFSIIEHQQI